MILRMCVYVRHVSIRQIVLGFFFNVVAECKIACWGVYARVRAYDCNATRNRARAHNLKKLKKTRKNR